MKKISIYITVILGFSLSFTAARAQDLLSPMLALEKTASAEFFNASARNEKKFHEDSLKALKAFSGRDQHLFAARAAKYFDSDFFSKLWGLPVRLISVETVGDMHMLLEPQIIPLSECVNETIINDSGVDLLSERFEREEESFIVYAFSYFVWDGSRVQRERRHYLKRKSDNPFDIIDVLGRNITAELVSNKTAIIDGAKKLTFHDAFGKDYALIYKPYATVESEYLGRAVFAKCGAGVEHQLMLQRDEHGSFAWVEYIPDAQSLTEGQALTREQAFTLGRIVPLFYLLGFSDATADNLLAAGSRLIPIDLEVLLTEDFFERYADFEQNYLNYRGGFLSGNSFLARLLREDEQLADAYQRGAQETIRILAEDKNTIVPFIAKTLEHETVNRRLLLNGTSSYQNQMTLHNVIPFYQITRPLLNEPESLLTDVRSRYFELMNGTMVFGSRLENLIEKMRMPLIASSI